MKILKLTVRANYDILCLVLIRLVYNVFIRRMRIDMYGKRLNSKDRLGYIALSVDNTNDILNSKGVLGYIVFSVNDCEWARL